MLLLYYLRAAVQPTFDGLTVKYGAQMQALNASSDAANLRTVGAALGWKSGLFLLLLLLFFLCVILKIKHYKI